MNEYFKEESVNGIMKIKCTSKQSRVAANASFLSCWAAVRKLLTDEKRKYTSLELRPQGSHKGLKQTVGLYNYNDATQAIVFK